MRNFFILMFIMIILGLSGCINTPYFNTDPGLRYFKHNDDLTMYVIYKDGSDQIDWQGVAEVLKIVEDKDFEINTDQENNLD